MLPDQEVSISPIFLCVLHGVMLIKNIPSITTVSGTHPDFSDVVMMGGIALAYHFSKAFVVLDLVPFTGLPSVVAIALGNSRHCS